MSRSIINLARLQPVVDAVLYEGYILYPYRTTSAKNRQRWTFGGIYPQRYSDATQAAEPWHMQTQCLLEGHADTQLEVRIRFLHPLAREVGVLEPALQHWPESGEPEFRRVPSLRVDDRQYLGWQEAMEHDVVIADCRLGDLLAHAGNRPFAFSGRRELSPVADAEGLVRGVLLRHQADVQGCVQWRAQAVTDRAYRLTVRIENLTVMDPARVAGRDQASLYSFASTHTMLGVADGAFISQLDPPRALEAAAAGCLNEGTYPVLIGEQGARDTMLSSPIILYDYPEVAPESPGDLYDALEIDEILSLRVLAMTDAEKCEMTATDPRAAALLARTEALDGDDFMRLHGVMREPVSTLRPVERPSGVAAAGSGLAYCHNGDAELKVGDHVRLRPRAGGDVMDVVLAGMSAVIESIERDFEDRLHVAVAIDDDPGREWGLQRMPGHRFFFSPEEIESLEPPSQKASA